jgi:hypothetical protein
MQVEDKAAVLVLVLVLLVLVLVLVAIAVGVPRGTKADVVRKIRRSRPNMGIRTLMMLMRGWK